MPTDAAQFKTALEHWEARLQGSVQEDGAVHLLTKVGGAQVHVVRSADPDLQWGVLGKARPHLDLK